MRTHLFAVIYPLCAAPLVPGEQNVGLLLAPCFLAPRSSPHVPLASLLSLFCAFF